MAYLIPENLGSRSDVPQAVRDVATAFRDDIDDDVTVWFDDGEESSPHLVVFDPAAGVLMVHVVEGGLRGAGKRRADLLANQLSGEAKEIAKRLDGWNIATFDVPTASTAAIPTGSATAAGRAGVDDPERFLLKEDFQPGALRAAVARILGDGVSLDLGAGAEGVVRAAIYPKLVIHDPDADEDEGRLLFKPPGDGGEDVIAVLDREQERLAHHLGEGYRVIKGVAGAGKTLVLTFRARHLAEAFPQWKILLGCYNRVLANALKADLVDLSNVTVSTVDGLAFQVCRRYRVEIDGKGDELFRQQRAKALSTLKGLAPTKDFSYDVVLLDEAQDLDDIATEFAHALLRPKRDDFIIALDAAQNIYRHRSRWTPEGTSGRGRTKLLRVNYRNTREILEVAHEFLMAGQNDDTESVDLDDPNVIIPPESSARRGEAPRILQSGSDRDALKLIAQDLKQANDAGTSWSRMAVMVGNGKLRAQMYHVAKDHKIPWFDLSHGRNRSKSAEQRDAVTGSTLQGLKGLEFERVYIAGIDNIEAGRGADDDTKRRLLYVGMTRATDFLMVPIHGRGPIVDSLLAAVSKV